MKILRTPREAHEYVIAQRVDGQSVGIVPTMGALHAGHISLATQSVRRCDCTIATIFVNPTQFAPDEDLDRYPRTFDQHCELLSGAKVNAVFAPDAADMYPSGFSTYVLPPAVAASLEGVCRPEHFRGVATVVLKLFQAVPATHAFFGKKDYQQLKVIQSMVRDLNVSIEVVGCEIVRETDGLAMSSRNRYLTGDQRERSLLLSQSLQVAERLISTGTKCVTTIENDMRSVLSAKATNSPGVDKIDYATVVDAETLSPIDQLSPGSKTVALIAAYVGSTRLIDNQEILVPA